jgi:hypothetical protein
MTDSSDDYDIQEKVEKLEVKSRKERFSNAKIHAFNARMTAYPITYKNGGPVVFELDKKFR